MDQKERLWVLSQKKRMIDAKLKRALSVKSLGRVWHRGSNGSSMIATRTTNKSHVGTRDHQGGCCDLSPSTHLATRG